MESIEDYNVKSFLLNAQKILRLKNWILVKY